MSFRRVRARLVAGALTGGERITSRESRIRRRQDLLVDELTQQGPCQVRSRTENPCLRSAEVEIRGVAFCGPCAHEQEAYFAIGELTHEDGRGLRSKRLGEVLDVERARAHGLHHRAREG